MNIRYNTLIRYRLVRFLPRKVWRVFWIVRRSLNYARCCLTDWRKMEHRPPEWLFINSIDVCNANCIFCGYQFHKPKGVMDMNTYEKALKEYVEMGGKNISFSPIVGEPLLDPCLLERVKLATSLGLHRIQLFTNGILLKEVAEKLLSSGLTEIHISLAGFNREMYIRVYRVNAYEKVIEGIKEVLKVKRKLKSNISVYLRLRPGDWRMMLGPDFWNNVFPIMDDNTYVSIAEFFDNWGGLIKHLSGDMRWRVTAPFRFRPCRETFSLAILPDGDVRACGCRFGEGGVNDDLVIGNIREKTLAELWHGPKIKEIRRMFTKSLQPEVCRKCLAYTPV